MRVVPLGLTSDTAEVPSHICLMYYGDDELQRSSSAFIQPALDEPGQGMLLFGPPGVASTFLGALEARAPHQVGAALDAGRLMLAESDADAGQQLENVIAPVETLARRGFSPIRILGLVAWDVASYALPEDFLWYESVLTAAIASLPVIVVCAYDVARLPAIALLMGGMESHPFVLAGGVLARNPHLVAPERFLRERLIALPWLDR